MPPMLRALPLALAVSSLPAGVRAAACSHESPAHTVALVELYTSEGCSSCPPADRWLMELPRRFSTDQVVPLALHVDYWDYIGWKDPFADPRFSARQREVSRQAGAGFVYTPAVFLGLKEARGWQDGTGFARQVESINRRSARAQIHLEMEGAGPRTAEIRARFEAPAPAAGGGNLEGRIAIFENGLQSRVAAGENSGRTLHHDFVVRHWSEPVTLDARTGQGEVRIKLPLPPDGNPAGLGIAAFVQDIRAGEILQATAMPACP